MDDEVKHTTDLYRLVAWAHARRKPLIGISVAVVAVAAIIGIYTWHANANENLAALSLSRIKPPAAGDSVTANAADPYLKIANDFQGTRASARALLVAGGTLFEAGKYKEAQDQFGRFLREYTDSPLVGQAAIGVAASLEAQGNIAEATSHYEELVSHHAMDSTAPQAKSALARLYVAQNKPEKAFEIYNKLAQENNQDTWSSEAGIQATELLQKYPNLRKPVASMTLPTASGTSAAPSLTLPKK